MVTAVGGRSVVFASNDIIDHAANDVDFSMARARGVASTIAPLAAVILRAMAAAVTATTTAAEATKAFAPTAACGAALA